MTQSGRPIVFVGDDPSLPRDLETAFDVVVRRDRPAIVEYVSSTTVGCVIVDGTGGERIATVATVRDAAPSVPIIYVTATPDGTAAAEATRAGATEYFTRSGDKRLTDRVAALSVDRGSATSIVSSPRSSDAAPETAPGIRSRQSESNGERRRAEQAAATGDVTEQHRHANVVTELRESTRALFSCDARADVASVVVDAAERLLGYDAVTVYLHDPETEELILSAASDTGGDPFDGRTRVDVHGSEMGDAFRESEPIVFDDVRTSAVDWQSDAGSVRGAMCIPIGDHGLLTVGSPVSGAFDEAHVRIAQLLTATAAAALERADRREDLRRHERILEAVEGMVYALDEDGRFIVVTDPLAERLGYDRERLLDEHVSLVFDEEAYDRAETHVRKLLADPQSDSGSFEAAYTTADGERFPVEIECSLLPHDGTYRGSVSVVRDITKRKEREQYLHVLNRVLRHNLRNDLTVVIGYAELLCDHLDDHDLAAAADTLRETAADLARTSEKTRAIQYALDRDGELQPIDVAAVVDETIERIDIDDATITLSTADSCRVWADPGLGLVVENLLENAIRHAGRAPTVEVSVTCEGDEVALTVTDDGPGIPPAEIDVVTGETDITQLTHSSGLGLWLVRWMVDSYGGTVSFSRPPAGGSRVEVRLEAVPSESTDAPSESTDAA